MAVRAGCPVLQQILRIKSSRRTRPFGHPSRPCGPGALDAHSQSDIHVSRDPCHPRGCQASLLSLTCPLAGRTRAALGVRRVGTVSSCLPSEAAGELPVAVSHVPCPSLLQTLGSRARTPEPDVPAQDKHGHFAQTSLGSGSGCQGQPVHPCGLSTLDKAGHVLVPTAVARWGGTVD